MSELLMNFANSQPQILTGIGQGIAGIGGQLIDQEVGKRKQEAYNTAMTNWEADGSKENLKNLYGAAQGMGILENTVQTIEAMDTLEQKNRLDLNMKVISSLDTGSPDVAVNYLTEAMDALNADGDTAEAKGVQNFIDMINNGDSANVSKNLKMVSGIIPGGIEAIDNLIGVTTEQRNQMKTDVEVAKTLDGMNITSPEQRDRIGSALAQMPSGMGDVLSQFLTVRSALDNGDMTLAELGKAEKDLRAEFDDYTKPYRTVIENVTSMEAMLQDPTGAVDFGVIRMFNKALDPNSVVRESEAAGTAAATGVLDRLSAKMENIKKGDLIGEDLRRDILEASKILQAGADENVSKQFNRLNETVKDFGYKDTRIWDKDDIEKYSNFSSFQAKAEETSEVDGFTEFILNKYPNEGDIVEGKSLEELKKEYSNTYKDFLGGSSGATTDFEGAEEL